MRSFCRERKKNEDVRCEGREKVCFIGSMNPHKRILELKSSQRRRLMRHYLHESNGRRFLAEALAAQVEAIFTNETRLVRAETAANREA